MIKSTNRKQNKIDLSSKSTLVEQIIGFIMNDLKTASPGDKILPERALAEKYDVSRKTAKGAVTRLTEQGLLERRVGKGTFVSTKINKLQDVLVNQLVYTDDFPHKVMSDVIADINNKKELVAPSFFFGDYRVFDIYEESIQNMVTSGEKLDIVALDEGILPILAKDKLIAPLDELLANSLTLNTELFHPAILKSFSYKNRLYGIPQTFSTYGLFYNKNLFKKAGIKLPDSSWNWDILIDAAEKMTVIDSKNGQHKSFGLGIFHLNPNILSLFLYQNFAPEIDISSINVFEQPETLEVIEKIYDLLHIKDICSPFHNNQLMTPAKIFAAGTLAMFIGSFQDYSELLNDPECECEWGVIELPHQKRQCNSLQVQGWGICSHSSCKDKSFAIIEQLLEEQRTKKIAESVRRIPAIYGHKNEQLPKAFINLLDFPADSMYGQTPTIAKKKAYRKEICLFLNKFNSPKDFCKKMAQYSNKA
jgi:multiple sugar transport system substrate-binding protein